MFVGEGPHAVNEIFENSDDDSDDGGMSPLAGADSPPPAEPSTDEDERARRNARIQYGRDMINRYQFVDTALQSDSDDSSD